LCAFLALVVNFFGLYVRFFRLSKPAAALGVHQGVIGGTNISCVLVLAAFREAKRRVDGRQDADCFQFLGFLRSKNPRPKNGRMRRHGGRLCSMLELVREAHQLRKAKIRRDADFRPRKG
jgi:hypothetical protein